jgi:PAH dioxygenase large subunit
VSLVRNGGAAVSRRVYLDETVFAEETSRIFAKAWQFVAHESEIESPGDYVTRRLGTDPVIVSRSERGDIHVLHNACRHRGAQMCGADLGNASHFRCSYHGWTYDNAGRLRGIPHAPVLYRDAAKNRDQFGLRSARVESFHGLIFANWDHDAVSLEEYLGDMAWYLETYFARDYEVVGPPTRLLGEHNWKSGAENWLADGYHAEFTHKLLMDAGVTAVTAEGCPIVDVAVAHGSGVPHHDPTMADLAVAQYTVGGGHSGLVIRLPLAFDEPVFVGYEGHLWKEFAASLTPEQIRMASTRIASVATVFPNFSFIEQSVQNIGDDIPPLTTLNIRIWSPVSATKTEIWNWVLVPKNAGHEWKTASQKAFARTLGAGGNFEVDDLQNWTGIAQSNSGHVGIDSEQYFEGKPAEQPSSAAEWPGKVYPGLYHDVMYREYFSEWGRWMGDVEPDPTSDEPSSGDVRVHDVDADARAGV